MAVQIYLVHLSQDHQQDDEASGALADLTGEVGGFVLMATSAGSLILAFDEQWLPLFRAHRAVAFCGAVRMDPNGAAAERLRTLFAANVAKQLAGRTQGMASTGPSPGVIARHRPLQWHLPQAAHEPSAVSVVTQRFGRR